MKKKFILLIGMLLMVGAWMFSQNSIIAHAEDADNVDLVQTNVESEDKDSKISDTATHGIVKIVAAYNDESGNIYYAKQGTGFVVGVNNTSAASKYIISDYGVVEGSNECLELIRKKYGLTPDAKMTMSYYAVGDMGVLTPLTIKSYSNETRYVVLEPQLPLADKKYLKLGSGDDVDFNTRVYYKGFTGKRIIGAETSVDERYIMDNDTVITDVKLEQYYNDTIKYFFVGESIDEGMAGAPIFNQDGCVIGMFIMVDDKMAAMSVKNIRNVLDALSINYMVEEDDETYDVPTEEQKIKLKSMIIDNKEFISKINRNFYTDATWQALYTAIDTADKTVLSATSTAKSYDDCMITLKKARKKLKTKAFKFIVINIVCGIGVLVLLFILYRILRKRSKLNKDKANITTTIVQNN